MPEIEDRAFVEGGPRAEGEGEEGPGPAEAGDDEQGQQSASAKVMEDAAEEGEPFCEECEKAKQEQQAQGETAQ